MNQERQHKDISIQQFFSKTQKNQIQSATQTYEDLLNEWSKEQSYFMQCFLDSIGNMFVEKVNISCKRASPRVGIGFKLNFQVGNLSYFTINYIYLLKVF